VEFQEHENFPLVFSFSVNIELVEANILDSRRVVVVHVVPHPVEANQVCKSQLTDDLEHNCELHFLSLFFEALKVQIL
jgi:hypothetical protein